MSYFIVKAGNKTLTAVDTLELRLLSFGVIIVLPGGIPFVQVGGLRERGKVQEHLEWINNPIEVGNKLHAYWRESAEPVQPLVVATAPCSAPKKISLAPLGTGVADSTVKNETDTSGIFDGSGFTFDIVLPANHRLSMQIEGEGTLHVAGTWHCIKESEWAIDAGSSVGDSSHWFSTTLTTSDWIEVNLSQYRG